MPPHRINPLKATITQTFAACPSVSLTQIFACDTKKINCPFSANLGSV
jgi:hypothetical protein